MEPCSSSSPASTGPRSPVQLHGRQRWIKPLGSAPLDTSGAFTAQLTSAHKWRGVVFKLTQSGGVWTESVLHDFDDPISDGDLPEAGVIATRRAISTGRLMMGRLRNRV